MDNVRTSLVLLRAAECRLGLAEALADCIREWRDPARTVHTLQAMLRFRMFAIRDAVPRKMDLAWAEFATLSQKLLKIGARVVEKAARVRTHFASASRRVAARPSDRSGAPALSGVMRQPRL